MLGTENDNFREGTNVKFLSTTVAAAAAALGLAAATGASAQGNYPSRPITMIVPFAAGGPTDVIARIVSDHMSRTLGQQIVVENVAGAGGTTGITRRPGAGPTATPS
jgi:tripartite-type tricarboxylate transporter receptor subunit TctC